MGGSLALEWGSTLYAGYTAGWPYHLMLALGMIVGFGALHTHTLQTLPLIVCVCASLFGVLQPQRVWEGMLRLSTGVALVRLVDGVIGSALPCSTYLLAIALATGASLLGAAFGVGVSAWLRRWRTWSLMT
jgi:hypothetical protein